MTNNGAQPRNPGLAASPAAVFARLVRQSVPIAVAGMLTLGAAVRPAVAYTVTLNLSGPVTGVVGQPMIIQASGFSDYGFLLWVEAGVIPASVVPACPSSHLDGGQVAAHAGGEILAVALRVLPDDTGNYANPIGWTPRGPGQFLICVYVADGYTNTFALASLTVDVQPGASTPTQPTATPTQPIGTTTTTLPACHGGGCEIETAMHGPACAGDIVPRLVTRKIDQAVQFVEQAEMSQSPQAVRFRRKARSLLALAGKAAVRASRGQRPKLSAVCAAAIQGAANTVRAGLAR
jgi:hypothetical protein